MDEAKHNTLEADLTGLHEAGEHARVTERIIEGYGGELCQYLRGMLHNEATVEDTFQELCIEILHRLPQFERRCSFRVWTYHLARGLACKVLRDPGRRRQQRLGTHDVHGLLDKARTATTAWRKTTARDRLWEACKELPEADQNLIVLRIKQRMSWAEIAHVLEDDALLEESALKTRAASLRKRFERIKTRLRKHLT